MELPLLAAQCFIVVLGGGLNVFYFRRVKNANALAASVLQVFIILSGLLTLICGWSGDLTFGILGAYFVYDALHSIINYQSFLDAVFVVHHVVGIIAMQIVSSYISHIEPSVVLFITCIEMSNFLRNFSDGWEQSWPRPILHYSFPFCKLIGPIYATTECFKGMPQEHFATACVTATVFGVITLCDAHQTYGEYCQHAKKSL